MIRFLFKDSIPKRIASRSLTISQDFGGVIPVKLTDFANCDIKSSYFDHCLQLYRWYVLQDPHQISNRDVQYFLDK